MKKLIIEASTIICGELICIGIGLLDITAYGIRLMTVDFIPNVEISNLFATIGWVITMIITSIIFAEEIRNNKF